MTSNQHNSKTSAIILSFNVQHWAPGKEGNHYCKALRLSYNGSGFVSNALLGR